MSAHPLKGRQKSEAHRAALSEASRRRWARREERERAAALMSERTGEQSYSWKGEGASPSAFHHWLNEHHPKTGRCEHCGSERLTHHAYLYHPKPHTRDRNDYAELCVSCHRRMDFRLRKGLPV